MKPNLLFILPNIFTAASIFLGFLSVVYASRGEYEKAVWCIAAAVVFDGLDGRIARLTNTTSKFGLEFDSLADLVAFGMAPAMLLYFFAGVHYGKIGIAVCAIFVVFGAVRLARFNSSTFSEPNVFIGFPIPAAAILLVFGILNTIEQNLPLQSKHLLFLAFIIGVVMVSNIRYPNFKKFSITPQSRGKIFVFALLLLFGLYIAPESGIFVIFLCYFIFGIGRGGYYLLSRKVIKR